MADNARETLTPLPPGSIRLELVGGFVVELGVGDEKGYILEAGKTVEVVHAGLGRVRDDDRAPSGFGHGPLGGGLDLVRGRQSAGDGEAVGAEEGDVDADVLEGTGHPVTDRGAGPLPHSATKDVELDVVELVERGGDRDRVGDHGQSPIPGELVGHRLGRRARVQEHCALVRQLGDGPGSDPLLLGAGLDPS